MTTVEHSLPVAVIYEDVRKLFEASGTAYTPTHIVSYGGVMGEQQIWAEEDIPNDPKQVFSSLVSPSDIYDAPDCVNSRGMMSSRS